MSNVLDSLSSALDLMDSLPSASDQPQAFDHVRTLASRRFSQVLTARLLVHHTFLKETYTKFALKDSSTDTADIGSFLQLRPSDIVNVDIFLDLTKMQVMSTWEWIGKGNPSSCRGILIITSLHLSPLLLCPR